MALSIKLAKQITDNLTLDSPVIYGVNVSRIGTDFNSFGCRILKFEPIDNGIFGLRYSNSGTEIDFDDMKFGSSLSDVEILTYKIQIDMNDTSVEDFDEIEFFDSFEKAKKKMKQLVKSW